jgi:hypothetical protein
MSIALTVAHILKDHVTLETESIDRLYLNAYVPQLQSEGAWSTSSASIVGCRLSPRRSWPR